MFEKSSNKLPGVSKVTVTNTQERYLNIQFNNWHGLHLPASYHDYMGGTCNHEKRNIANRVCENILLH